MALSDGFDGFRDDGEHYTLTFTDRVFTEQRLAGAVYDNCEFAHCNFSGTQFVKCKFAECRFIDCNLSNIGVAGTRMSGAQFIRCKMVGIDWTRATWPNVPIWPQLCFVECVLNDSSFFGLHCEELVVRACKVHEADFREGRFARGDFSASDLRHSLFAHTDLSACDFTEAINYDIDLAHNRVSRSRFTRSEAVRLLNFLDIELSD